MRDYRSKHSVVTTQNLYWKYLDESIVKKDTLRDGTIMTIRKVLFFADIKTETLQQYIDEQETHLIGSHLRQLDEQHRKQTMVTVFYPELMLSDK
jgi:hypothetical protein